MNARIVIGLLVGVVALQGATAGEKAAGDVHAQVEGAVERIHVKAGDVVKKGQVLLELDARVQKLEVEKARAKFATASADLALSVAEFNRATQLPKQNAISPKEFEEIQSKRAKAQVDEQKARISLEIARLVLERATVRAPVSGTVTLVKVNVGQSVKSDELILRLEPSAPSQNPEKIQGAAAGAKTTIDVHSRLASVVAGIHVKEGGLVKKGDLLVDLDDRAQQAELQAANGKVALAQAKLKLRDEQLKLFAPLVAKGTISKEELGKAAEERAKAQASVAEAEAERASAKHALELTSVRAPVDGVVKLVQVKLGEAVKKNDLLVRLEGKAPPQDSDKVKALLKERRDLLARAVKVKMQDFATRRVALNEVAPLELALLEVSLELAESPQERLQLLQGHVQFHENVSRMAKARFDAGVGTESETLAAQVEWLAARIRLARAEAANEANKK